MNNRRLPAFLDSLADGRRPKDFDAAPEDVEVLRTAIELRAARPGDAQPDAAFVSRLHHELSAQARSGPASISQPVKRRRRSTAVAAIAASFVLVGATAAATEALSQGPATQVALGAPRATSLRTGTFETTDGQVMGQIVAYKGSPSWVYMNVGDSNYTGSIVCKLQVDNGSTVATGAFMLHAGKGEWTKAIHVDIGRLRGATLVNSSGDVVASATLS